MEQIMTGSVMSFGCRDLVIELDRVANWHTESHQLQSGDSRMETASKDGV